MKAKSRTDGLANWRLIGHDAPFFYEGSRNLPAPPDMVRFLLAGGCFVGVRFDSYERGRS